MQYEKAKKVIEEKTRRIQELEKSLADAVALEEKAKLDVRQSEVSEGLPILVYFLMMER